VNKQVSEAVAKSSGDLINLQVKALELLEWRNVKLWEELRSDGEERESYWQQC